MQIVKLCISKVICLLNFISSFSLINSRYLYRIIQKICVFIAKRICTNKLLISASVRPAPDIYLLPYTNCQIHYVKIYMCIDFFVCSQRPINSRQSILDYTICQIHFTKTIMFIKLLCSASIWSVPDIIDRHMRNVKFLMSKFICSSSFLFSGSVRSALDNPYCFFCFLIPRLLKGKTNMYI